MNTATPSQELPIEKRVATLEQQMAAILRSHPVASQAAENHWLSTVGTWRDDAFSREADQLGEAWRQSVKD
jgi:hypothetical protein